MCPNSERADMRRGGLALVWKNHGGTVGQNVEDILQLLCRRLRKMSALVVCHCCSCMHNDKNKETESQPGREKEREVRGPQDSAKEMVKSALGRQLEEFSPFYS